MSSIVSGEWGAEILSWAAISPGRSALRLVVSPVEGRLALAPEPLIKRSRGWYSQLRLLAPSPEVVSNPADHRFARPLGIEVEGHELNGFLDGLAGVAR